MIYDIYLLQMDFHPVAVVGKLIKKRDSYIQKEKQYTKNTKTQNTQNRKQTHETRK
jgi:cobalamin biosynthesis protein CobD/CbiB